ncbi:PREDICTED: GATA transcription factor 17-like [Prunus mume]|uniref:GATA transcription factor 17-like n=1 Tax=Prunus mume TaxID=102107 RepID=A0ABM0PWR0_PRUMU|nr:PREDICTED: GATA transcription factor 17-like [Prunus mume]
MMNWGRRFVALESVLGRKEPFPQAMNGNKKRCSDCMTTETPLWRGGPAGPKSLCNACGIRHRKRGIPTVSLMSKAPKRRREKTCGGSSSTITTTYNIGASATYNNASATTAKSTFGSGGGGINLNEPPKVRFVGFGEEVFLQDSQAEGEGEKQSQWREWGEVEQAAVCLLAMSCDSVFA